MDVSSFLQRIGLDAPVPLNRVGLATIFEYHSQHIAFENLDLIRGQNIIIDPTTWYTKIVHQRRGGVCLEVNGLLGTMLRKMGFQVDFLQGRFLSPQLELSRPYGHVALRVHLDQPYLVDAAFRYAPLQPIPLTEGTFEDKVGTCELRECAPQSYDLIRHMQVNGKEIACYRIFPEAVTLKDFATELEFIQHDTDSEYNKQIYVSRASAEGFHYMRDLQFSSWSKDKVDRSVCSREELQQVLQEKFSIDASSFNL
ncbi:MAG: arylamine N-acetyltransferase [Zetaproteobacteria bacterium]|nr:arylamine N-acetyltransferase [Zetaproteobacteria bacterium]